MPDSIATKSLAELTRHVFAGDEHAEALSRFLSSQQQYDGDLRWLSGTSLKSTWLSLFEFMNGQPVSQFWTDASDEIVALTTVWPGRWRMQCSPEWRHDILLRQLAEHAGRLCALLTPSGDIQTSAYSGNAQHGQCLESLGYVRGDKLEVFMERALAPDESFDVAAPDGVVVRELDPRDASQMAARAMAQGDAFGGGVSDVNIDAWQRRNIYRAIRYGNAQTDFLASDSANGVLAFASVQADCVHGLGEFEPVGTRTSSQRRGLSKLLMWHGLRWLQAQGVRRAAVRTGINNVAAVRTYESVGFAICDHQCEYTRTC